MSNESVFTFTSPELLSILEELRSREPIFHTLAFAASPAEYEQSTAPEYWEVGASGRRYSRDFILRELYTTQPPLAERWVGKVGTMLFDASDRTLFSSRTCFVKVTALHVERPSGSTCRKGGASCFIKER